MLHYLIFFEIYWLISSRKSGTWALFALKSVNCSHSLWENRNRMTTLFESMILYYFTSLKESRAKRKHLNCLYEPIWRGSIKRKQKKNQTLLSFTFIILWESKFFYQFWEFKKKSEFSQSLGKRGIERIWLFGFY